MNETEHRKTTGIPGGIPMETRMTAEEIEDALRKGATSYVIKSEHSLVGSRRAAARLAEAAEREGLLDVAYGFADSPFGQLMVAVTPRGLVRLDYPDRDLDETLQELASEISPRILAAPKATDQVRRELDEYFAGTRREFTLPIDMSPLVGFRRRVLEETASIPYGSVSTYAEVAKRAGSPRGMRAAGNALGSNPIPIVVPCHRVLRSGGGLGGYTGGLDRKVTLLRLEGVLEG